MADIEYKVVWQKNDKDAQSDARKLWKELNMLPSGVSEESRAASLCVVAYAPGGEELVAVSTIGLSTLPQVNQRMAFFRCLVRPEYREKAIATELAVRCKEAMEEWSFNNPLEGVMGFGTIVESEKLSKKSLLPVWPKTGLALVGYTQRGQQIRMVWFKHVHLGEGDTWELPDKLPEKLPEKQDNSISTILGNEVQDNTVLVRPAAGGGRRRAQPQQPQPDNNIADHAEEFGDVFTNRETKEFN